jgi:hypothetical protein
MRGRLLSFPLAALLVFAVAAPTTAITKGTADGDNHPYVGLIVFYTDVDGVTTPSWSCSGSLFSPTVFLTAAHCLTLAGPAVAARVWSDPELTGSAFPSSGPLLMLPASGGIPAASWTAYDGWQVPGDPGDFAVVILSQVVTVPQYARLPTAGTVDTLPNQAALDLVGWGAQFQDKVPGFPFARWDGVLTRFYVPSELISGNFSYGRDNLLRISASQGGICRGDSGGPDLLGGTDTVLAVNTGGNNWNCAGVFYATRLDLQERLDWINGFLD